MQDVGGEQQVRDARHSERLLLGLLPVLRRALEQRLVVLDDHVLIDVVVLGVRGVRLDRVHLLRAVALCRGGLERDLVHIHALILRLERRLLVREARGVHERTQARRACRRGGHWQCALAVGDRVPNGVLPCLHRAPREQQLRVQRVNALNGNLIKVEFPKYVRTVLLY